jgi:regulator of sirC expression with transglutaminase-like and TPR domain
MEAMSEPQTARERFAELATTSDLEIDLGEAALLIAREARPDLDVQAYLGALDMLADGAREFVLDAQGLEAVVRLNEYLFEHEHFVGNQTDFYDVKNSFLDQVIERRRGIPITLAVVYLEVARRIGLEVSGVSFPGHFLLRTADEPPVMIDPFYGSILTREDCADLLQQAYGDDAELEPEHFEPATPRQILARMLSNLKQIYVEKDGLEDALACSDRILMLLPDAPFELRDRGLIYAQLECFGAAVADLERFIELAGEGGLTEATREILDALRERALQIH